MMDAILDFLNTQAFALGGTPVYIVELFGFVLGILTLYFLVKENVLTFPFGIAMVTMFFIVFINSKLYADAWLQVFFIVIQFIGWWAWLKAGPNRTELKIRNSNWFITIGTLLLVGALIVILKPILADAHGSYPLWDAAGTSLSIGAQILLTFKVIENWYLWIVADLIYVPLFWAKGLYFTSILYTIFLGMCVAGIIEWHKYKRLNSYSQPPARPVGHLQEV
jgi:nicotinamide mononucleotide transporter